MTTITLSRTSETFQAFGIVSALVASVSEFYAGARDGQEIEARFRTYSRMSGPDLRPSASPAPTSIAPP